MTAPTWNPKVRRWQLNGRFVAGPAPLGELRPVSAPAPERGWSAEDVARACGAAVDGALAARRVRTSKLLHGIALVVAPLAALIWVLS